MLTAAGQAFREMFTPPFRAVLFKCVGFTIALLVLLIVGRGMDLQPFRAVAGLDRDDDRMARRPGARGRLDLSDPAGHLADRRPLSRRHRGARSSARIIPADPPGKELPTLPAIWLALKFFFVVLLVNIVALFLLLVPGVNLIAFYIGNGYLLGREYFELAAMRHMPPAEAKKLRQANRLTVFLCGLIIAGIASVPILNLITPLFATAFMVRMYKDLARRAGPRIAVRPARERVNTRGGAAKCGRGPAHRRRP